MKIHNKLIKSTTVAEKADLRANFIITILTRTGLHTYTLSLFLLAATKKAVIVLFR